MGLLTSAIVLLLLSVLISALYTYRFEKARRQRQPKIVFGTAVTFFIAGTTMLFFAAGWKAGLAGLGASWLAVLVVNFAIAVTCGVKEYVDPLLKKRVNEVGSVEERHNAELENFWNSTSLDECASLMVNFLDELRHNWPREYSQLNPERLPDAISRGFKDGITQAYKVGYMRGKGWISQEHLVDFTLYLGDKLASDLMQVFKNAKSRGNAFASGYVAVAVHGHLQALQK